MATATATCFAAGFAGIFSLFQSYDDEGYLLLTLKEFQANGHLYGRVYSQYGPFYHQLFGAVFGILGIQIDHDSGRLITLFAWLAVSTLAAMSAWRLTRNLGLAAATQVLTFLSLWTLINEPMHPGGLTTLLVVSATLALIALYPRNRRIALVLLGAITGATLMVKINVGGLLLIALAYALSGALRRGRMFAVCTSAGVMVATPAVLMASHLAQWVGLATTVTLALAAVVIGGLVAPVERDLDWRDIGLGLLGLGAVVGVSCAFALATGSSASDLLQGIVLIPLRHPNAFSLPIRLDGTAQLMAAAVAVATLLRYRWQDALRPFIPWAVIGAGLALLALALPAESAAGKSLAPELIIAPLAGWLSIANGSDAMARRFLPAVAVVGALQVYPVAGSQVGYAAALFIPLGALAVNDGWHALGLAPSPTGAGSSLKRRALPAVLGLLIAGTMFAALALHPRQALEAYRTGVSPGLPGTALMRLPPSDAHRLRTVADVIRANCETFVSIPGLDSLYFFTAEPPPNGMNTTAWPWLLNRDSQQSVVSASRAHRRVCAVRNRSALLVWEQGRPVPDGPLVEYLDGAFPRKLLDGDYEVWANS